MTRPLRLPFWVLLICCLATIASAQRRPIGFDSNVYPGDSTLTAYRRHFDFMGYWLTPPPGSHTNNWLGRREAIRSAGFGFLVLANGKLDKEILAAGRSAHVAPAVLGESDGKAAATAARREHFPAHTLIFLDQEEGGRLLPEQLAYLLGWTEAVTASEYRAGVYLSGQAVPDGPGRTVTTAQNLQQEIAARHLHEVALWVYQDACPPAPGCTLQPPALAASGTPGAIVWQYAQSPRRPALTASCAKTYASDGNCYAPEFKKPDLDLDVAASADPSAGR